MRSTAAVVLAFSGIFGLSCSSEELGDAQGDGPGTDTPEPTGCEARNGAPAASSPATVADAALPDAPRLVELYAPASRRSATALAFNTQDCEELWITLRQFPVDAPCTEAVSTGCAALRGEVVWLAGATSAAPTHEVRRDGNAWHFMRRPTSIAFGDNGNLATCGEARTDNYDDDVIDYAGPVLWSSDPAIFGVKPQEGQNGTHLDMLHATPFCMGIAHESENVYWTFNGQLGALDRYDFNEPHAIGGEDHTDGELQRYLTRELSREPEVPSHLALDSDARRLYVADTGNGRIVSLDIDSGTPGADVTEYDGMPVHVAMEGANFEELVAPGTLELPSGIALRNGVVFVTDNGTSLVHAFDERGVLLKTANTGLAAGSLAGIAIGPDGKAYLTDLLTGKVYRLEAE